MTKNLSIDIETFSSADISNGVFKYAQALDFQVLLFAYSVDGGPVQVVDLTRLGSTIPQAVVDDMLDDRVIKHAYNAIFEVYCLTRHFGYDDTFASAWLPQWRCTMLQGTHAGYPAGLDAVGKALGLEEDKKKLSTGKALIRYFCVPCKPTKANGGRTRNLPGHDLEKWELFKEYCGQDVVTEIAVAEKLKNIPIPDDVQAQWVLDQQINIRGVAVDTGLVIGAQTIDQEKRGQMLVESKQLTGLENPNSLTQLAPWIEGQTGRFVDSLTKEAVSKMLKEELPPKAERVLKLRQELGKTSVKKYDALAEAVCEDGRVRGLFQFYGAARTGRWAGRIVQPQNLPRTYIEGEMLSTARRLVTQQNGEGIGLVFGNVSDTLSQLIRTAFIPRPDCFFVDADFSAIEARVVAWLAGEDWVLDVFRTHGKIYEATAANMFGVPIEKIKKGNPEYSYRQKGKVATLALGYQGGVGALEAMGALDMGIPGEELPDIVERWRNANQNIVNLWYAVEAASREAVEYGTWSTVGRVAIRRELDENKMDFLTIELPSGRKLYYPSPAMAVNRFNRPSLSYMGQNQTTKKWERLETYGGKLVENITQAVARDCLAEAMIGLEKAGYRTVMHIHDEVVLEVPRAGEPGEEENALKKVVEIMSQPPAWAADLPLNADGWTGEYFRKE